MRVRIDPPHCYGLYGAVYEAALRSAMGDAAAADADETAYGETLVGEKGVLSDVVDCGTDRPRPLWLPVCWAMLSEAMTSIGGCAAFWRRRGEDALGWRVIG